MARDFKKQMNQRQEISPPRFPVVQLDPEAPRPSPAGVEPAVQAAPVTPLESAAPVEIAPATTTASENEGNQPARLTIVDASEAPAARGTQMRPSRHRQLRDLAYEEDRKFWLIIDDALEEYVVKHYGKQYKRRAMDK